MRRKFFAKCPQRTDKVILQTLNQVMAGPFNMRTKILNFTTLLDYGSLKRCSRAQLNRQDPNASYVSMFEGFSKDLNYDDGLCYSFCEWVRSMMNDER